MEEDFSDTLSKYTLAVNENLKGDIDSKLIAVYEAKGKLYLDKDYLLFLEKLNNPLYPEHSYTSFEKAMITEVNNGKILSDNKLYSNETDLNKITAAISNSKENFKLNNKNYEVIDELQTITDLIEESDYVLHILSNNVIERNPNVAEVTAKVVQQFKGSDMVEDISLFLPKGVQKDKEYIVFLKNYDGGLLPATRRGSVIESGTSGYSEAINLLSKNH